MNVGHASHWVAPIASRARISQKPPYINAVSTKSNISTASEA